MKWIKKWRQIVEAGDDAARRDDRNIREKTVDGMKRKALKLSKKIQHHTEEYDRMVVDASMRKGPKQNGSEARQFIAYAQMDQKSELAQRPSDRQIFSRVYSRVDNDRWMLDEARSWYNKRTNESMEPLLPLESYGYKAVGLGRTLSNGTIVPTRMTVQFPEIRPMDQGPRLSKSAAQARQLSMRPPKDPVIHWANYTSNLQQQMDKIPTLPNYGRMDVCAPPFIHPPPK